MLSRARVAGSVLALLLWLAACSPTSSGPAAGHGPTGYPIHRDIVATTFWVGEILDPHSLDGSQVMSTYDNRWMAHYGGCDGVVESSRCRTEPRSAVNGFFPTRMTPLQNPFYLDLPFDDLHDPVAFARRSTVVPWAQDPGYAGHSTDRSFSYLKNRWVEISHGDRTCYGQVEDAGPAQYHDARYVFDADDHRPVSRKFDGAGLDVSPALNGCLDFSQLDGVGGRVDWRFVNADDVSPGPWRRLVTTVAPSSDQ